MNENNLVPGGAPPVLQALRDGFWWRRSGRIEWFFFPGFWAASLAPEGTLSSQSERTAMAAGWGAAIGGADAIVAVKGVGLADACNEFLHAHLAGVEGALVVCVFDDVEVEGSQSQFDSRHFFSFFGGLWLEPHSMTEAFDFAHISLTVSRRIRMPVVIRIVNSIIRMNETIPASPSSAAKRLISRKSGYGRAASLAPPIVHPSYAEKQLEQLRRKNQICQWYSNQLYRITEHKPSSPGEDATLHHNIMPPPNRTVWQSREPTSVLHVFEGPDPVISNALRAANGDFRVRPHITSLDPRHASGYRSSDAFETAFKIVRDSGLYVFGDLGSFTIDPAATVRACLCLGAAPASALGYSLAFERASVALIGDTAFMHSGVIGTYETIRRRAEVKIIVIDNGSSVSTGGQVTGDLGFILKAFPDVRELFMDDERMPALLAQALGDPGPQVVALRVPGLSR